MNKQVLKGIVTGKDGVDTVFVRVDGRDELFECYTMNLIRTGTEVEIVVSPGKASGYINNQNPRSKKRFY